MLLEHRPAGLELGKQFPQDSLIIVGNVWEDPGVLERPQLVELSLWGCCILRLLLLESDVRLLLAATDGPLLYIVDGQSLLGAGVIGLFARLAEGRALVPVGDLLALQILA